MKSPYSFPFDIMSDQYLDYYTQIRDVDDDLFKWGATMLMIEAFHGTQRTCLHITAVTIHEK